MTTNIILGSKNMALAHKKPKMVQTTNQRMWGQLPQKIPSVNADKIPSHQ